MLSNWLSIRRFIFLFFVPAGVGLVWHVLCAQTLAQQLLALALVLFCIELAVMAKVDLDDIATVQQTVGQTAQQSDSQLYQFSLVVASTIVLELLGFYVALFFLPVGALVVVFSQLWFNLLAQLQLRPDCSPAVVPFGLSQRAPVLLADGAGLVLLSLWFTPLLSLVPIELTPSFVTQLRRGLGGGLLALVVLFLLIKYVIPSVFSITGSRSKGSKNR